jgi:hypothetical protein
MKTCQKLGISFWGGLMKTCQKLGISFWGYLGHRLGLPDAIPVQPLAEILRLRQTAIA